MGSAAASLPVPLTPVARVTSASADEERGLLSAAAAGDDAAFATLVERLAPRLWRHLVAHGTAPADADDLVQETFVRVDRHRARYDRRWAPTTWIWTIARNLAHNLATRRQPTRPLPEEMPAAEPPEAPATDGPGEVWSTAKAVLDARSYAALWLRYGEERDDDAIAAALRTSPGNVRVLLHRARKRLGEVLSAQETTP